MSITSIYPQGTGQMATEAHSNGQRRPVCVGKDWGCDRQFQPINPRETLQNELFKRVEVPSCLNAGQYLDIISASPAEG